MVHASPLQKHGLGCPNPDTDAEINRIAAKSIVLLWISGFIELIQATAADPALICIRGIMADFAIQQPEYNH